MSPVTVEELEAGREDLADLLWERCTLYRRQQPGGAWTPIAPGFAVPCRLTLIGSQVAGGLALAAADVNANAVLSLPAGTSLGDLATVAGQVQAIVEGRRFEARMVAPRQAFLMRVLGSVEG